MSMSVPLTTGQRAIAALVSACTYRKSGIIGLDQGQLNKARMKPNRRRASRGLAYVAWGLTTYFQRAISAFRYLLSRFYCRTIIACQCHANLFLGSPKNVSASKATWSCFRSVETLTTCCKLGNSNTGLAIIKGPIKLAGLYLGSHTRCQGI